MTLNQLNEGQSGQISRLETSNNALLRQCQTLGLVQGALVQVIRPTRGRGPMQVKCSGTLYAVRANEAAFIHVAPV